MDNVNVRASRSSRRRRSRSRGRSLTPGQVGGVDTVSLCVVQLQRRSTAAVIRAHGVHTGSAHTALLLALIVI